MGKIKVNKRDGFTVISNHVLRNKNITLKAKGLYAYMWSLPDDWDYSVAGLVKTLKEGKDAINEALRELEREGYLVRTTLKKGGRFYNMDYILHETPQKVPFTEKPQAEKPFTEKPQQINTNITKEKKKEKTLSTKEGKASKKKSYKDVYSDPVNVHIKDALVKFVNACKGMNYTPRVSTVESFAETLRNNAGESKELAMKMVDQSISKGWKAIYPLKGYKMDQYKTSGEEDELARNEDGSLKVY